MTASSMRRALGSGNVSDTEVLPTGATTARTLADLFANAPHISDFSSSVSGGDWQAAIAAAVAAAVSASVSRVLFDDAEYDIGATITIGNGDVSAYSTVNSIELVGAGAPFIRLKNGSPATKNTGTRFKWVGASGGTMVNILGPCQGNGISNIALNGNDLAGFALRLISASRGYFPFLTLSDFTNTGLLLNCVAAESIGGATEGLSTEGNRFLGLRIGANDTASSTIAIDLDGYLGSASNGKDSLRNYFENTYLIVNRVGGTGIRLAFCDQNLFHHTTMSGFKVADGNQASIRFVRSVRVPGGGVFPQTNVFSGHTDIGQQLPVVIDNDAGIGEGNRIENLTSLDQQVPLTGHVARFISGTIFDKGIFPRGGFWSEFGQNVSERTFRNKLINATFHRTTRGTSFTDPSNGSYTLDGMRIAYDGGDNNFTLSRQAFTPGQTDVPYEPKYYMQIAQTGAIGGTIFQLQQRIRHVELLAGRRTVLSAWLRFGSSNTLTGRMVQNFGTGGSPSDLTSAESGELTIGTAWDRYDFRILAPSISGETLGSNDDDYVEIVFKLPTNVGFTLDIALPQWEQGDTATAFDLRGEEVDVRLADRYLYELPAPNSVYGFGPATTANFAEFMVTLPEEMIAIPTLEVAGVATDYDLRDYTGANGGACTGVPIIVTADKRGALLKFASNSHGLTLGTTARLEENTNGQLLLTAEL